MERFRPLDIACAAVAFVASTPIICLVFRPDLFMKVATNPILTEPVKYLLLILGN
ncbi:MAG: hypothetical protein AAB768_04160 [Patescibacteria group bacterium]